MPTYEIVFVLLAACVGLGLLARFLRMPYPILLTLAGLLVSIQPWAMGFSENLRLPQDVVFFVFLPPLLYAGAFNTNWVAFRAQLRAISILAIGLVVFSTVCVAAVAHHVVGLGWGPAMVLGAIVSPPDAVAAMAIMQRVRVPKIISTILEGESLVNDASALVVYRLALAYVAGEMVTMGGACGQFALVSAGGILVGVAGGIAAIALHRWIDRCDLGEPKLVIAITLLTPYAVYFPAEHVHVSGVLAVVAAGLWVGTRCEKAFRHEIYIEARAVWEMVEFLLNSVIFILIGFQLPHVLNELGSSFAPTELAGFAAAVSGVLIAARMIWVIPGAYGPRWLDRVAFGTPVAYPPLSNVIVVGWAGMRGVVSMAAAMALPAAGGGFTGTERGMIQFLTFWVIMATLVGQGLTLPLVIRVLGVGRDETEAAAEVASGPGEADSQKR